MQVRDATPANRMLALRQSSQPGAPPFLLRHGMVDDLVPALVADRPRQHH
jgi:hypothetical protein